MNITFGNLTLQYDPDSLTEYNKAREIESTDIKRS